MRFSRDIYIHGTPEERNIGRPASYGCVRMKSRDVINLYGIVGQGARVSIVNAPTRRSRSGFDSPCRGGGRRRISEGAGRSLDTR